MTRAYYNECNADMAEWLRVLIEHGIIAPGDVDERSIVDVRADDLKGYCQCHFFAGLGGWSLALRQAGWPDDRPVWSGSCPCQPFSTAGKRQGQADERHLWPEFAKLIRERRPEHVFGEQVASAIGHGWLDGVSADLEAAGYAIGATVLGAHSVGAPHIRQRLYWYGGLSQSQGRAGQSDARATSGVQEPLRLEQRKRLERDGETGRLSDAPRDGLAILGSAPGSGRHAAQQCALGGIHHPNGAGRDAGRGGSAAVGCGGAVEPTSSACRSCNAIQPGLEGLAGHGDGSGEPGRVAAEAGRHAGEACGDGFWSDFSLLPYRDGKTRRVEPEPVGLADRLALVGEVVRTLGLDESQASEILSTYPLARDFPGRRMLLSGYGNAIVIPLAAAFVRAAEV